MIEANAIALNFPAVAEIAGGSTSETVVVPQSEKRILKPLDQRRFLLSIRLEAPGILAKRYLTDFCLLAYARRAVIHD
jgi:hypothetical protein